MLDLVAIYFRLLGIQVRDFAPIGMMEYWNSGIMGFGIMQYWFDDKICVGDIIKNGYLPFDPPWRTILPALHYSMVGART